MKLIYRVPLSAASRTIGALFRYSKDEKSGLLPAGLRPGSYRLQIVAEHSKLNGVEHFVEVWTEYPQT